MGRATRCATRTNGERVDRADGDGQRPDPLPRCATAPAGRESVPRYGGKFRTMREAKARRDYVAGELAALRVPAFELVGDAAGGRDARRERVARGSPHASTSPTARCRHTGWRSSGCCPASATSPPCRARAAPRRRARRRARRGGLRKQTIRKTVKRARDDPRPPRRAAEPGSRPRSSCRARRSASSPRRRAEHVAAFARALPRCQPAADARPRRDGHADWRTRGARLGRRRRARGRWRVSAGVRRRARRAG